MLSILLGGRCEVGADCYGRCAGVVTGHVESLRAGEWGYFVGAYLVGVGGFADDQRGRKLMSWESTGDFKTLDDIVAYGNARVEAERERIIEVLENSRCWRTEIVPCQCGGVTPSQVEGLTKSIKYMEGENS
jgi:hypothetical protein